ncbi:myelin-associated glycoprotein-like [Misgurnus anguillicaudatus]|uniref:myelin-associated glycoprotein-like n=1 Tax=Misgurnus anguillicaudatus TaxID=75329 RepID=UPI003CCF81C7
MGAKTTVLLLWLQVFWVFVFADVWKVEVQHEMKALVKSCVVLPCSFQYPGTGQPSARTRGIWHKKESKNKDYVYSEDKTLIEDNFKGRTRLVGRLGEKNCSLEIDDVKDHDNGPFCFRVELETSEKKRYSFVDNCVHISMIEQASQPELHSDQAVQEGRPAIFRCSVRHTCPSHQPNLTWNHDGQNMMSYKDIGHGNWEVESILTFTPTKDDDHSDIMCTVNYHGVKDQFVASRAIFVKELATLNHILIPVFCGLGVALLVGGLSFFIIKKYKKRIEDLQSRDDNGVWSRLSRMSRRFRSGGNSAGPDRRDQRRSIWSRFSRRGHGDQTDRKIDNRSDKSGNKVFSKPRMPSPKSQPKSCSGYDYDDDYTNTADLNVYGNV